MALLVAAAGAQDYPSRSVRIVVGTTPGDQTISLHGISRLSLENSGLPTSGEQRLPTLLAVNWFGVLAPAKTPRPIVETLHTAFVRAANAPEIKQRLIDLGVESMTSPSTQAFTRFQREELLRWGKLVRQANVKAD